MNRSAGPMCAFTAVCEDDARWLPQYLAEMKRLDLPFVMHFDRCSAETKKLVRSSRQYVGCSAQDRPAVEFDETHKQRMMDQLLSTNFTWAMAMDVDETWDGQLSLATIQSAIKSDADYIGVTWVNVWERPDQLRTDPPFKCMRDKFYRVRSGPWVYAHMIINGPKRTNRLRTEERPAVHVGCPELVCLHWGLMTRELREQHKARWDRVYNAATKGDGNPYGIWTVALDEATWPPRLEPNEYM